MSIQEHLNKIRNAVKGSEVRESIAKGIETTYDDASEYGNANMEVKIARGTHPTLRDRLNEVDNTQQQTTAQLAQVESEKVDKSGTAQIEWQNTAQSLRERILGVVPSAVLGVDDVLPVHISDNAVSERNVSFVKKSSNLFNTENEQKRKVITDAGLIIENGDYNTLNPINVKPSSKMSFKGIDFIAEFDVNNNFIKRSVVVELEEITLTDNTHRVVISYRHWTSLVKQINKGSLVAYEPYFDPYLIIKASDYKPKSIFTDALKDDSVTLDKAEYIKKSSNLFNIDKLNHGYTINNNGDLVANSDLGYGEPIEVNPGEKIYTEGILYMAGYDENGNFTYRYGNGLPEPNEIEVPQNVKSMVPLTSYYNSYIVNRTAKINRGSSKPFEPYYKKMKDVKVEEEIHLNDFKNQTTFLRPIDDLLTLDTTIGSYDTTNLTPETLYGMFDSLVTTYPTLVTKESLGKDTLNERDINMYHFGVKDVSKPVIILISGVHGYEKTSPYILFKSMEKVIESQTNGMLNSLKNDVEIVVVPVANPTAWDNSGRTNSNGVDISRNFEYRWANAAPPTGTSKGTSPLSEVESQYIDTLINRFKDRCIYMTSLHNFSASDAGQDNNNFIWSVGNGVKQADIVTRKLITRLSNKWSKTYDWLPDGVDFGYIGGEEFGMESSQAMMYGIVSNTFELSRIFMLEPEPKNDSSIVMTLGVETLINYLYMHLNYGIDYYNKYDKPKNKFNALSL